MTQQSPRGTFMRIAETLRAEISEVKPSGGAAPVRLGTEAELSGRFGVARNTLRKALGELARQGLIYSEPARGWFVGQPAEVFTTPGQNDIAAELAKKISTGEFAPGAKFATAPAIAETYGVTRHAARLALLALNAQGLIESRHGKGWFVRGEGR